MRKFFLFLILIVFLFLFFFSGSKFEVSGVKTENPATLLFVGDIMLSREIGKIIEREGVDFPCTLIKDTTNSADITFGNLENPVSVRGENVGSIYSFRALPETLLGLKNAGFDIVSIANNHIFDYGEDALLDTLGHLYSYGIIPVGAGKTHMDAHAPYIVTKNGIRFGFLAYSEFAEHVSAVRASPNVAGFNPKSMQYDIAKAKQEYGADYVIVSVHWGEEYKKEENDAQKEIAHMLIDGGANFVIGHHPHVVQSIEEYKGGVIAYSLGNFVFDQNFSKDTREGLMLEIEVEKEKIKSYKSININFTRLFQPYIITQ